MPKIENDEDTEARCRQIKRPDVSCPVEALHSGIQGDVVVEFVVMLDGSARNPRIIYAVPTDTFESTVRAAVLHTHHPAGGPGSRVIHCHVMYRFQVAGWATTTGYPDLETLVRVTRTKAESGDTHAQLLHGLLLAGLPQLGHRGGDAVPWFLKAAQAGSPSGQYMLGSSLLLGMGCHCAEYALRGTPDAANTKLAAVWLERAAASGDHDGIYYLSALLAATPIEAMRDPKRALDLLEKVRTDVSGNPTAVEIRAAAQAASAAFKDAVSSERRAIAMAAK
jgi:hypothetical protein